MLAGAAAPGLEPAVLAGRDRGTPSVAGPDLTARSSLFTDDGRSLSIPTSRKYHMILGPNLPDVVRVVSFSFFLSFEAETQDDLYSSPSCAFQYVNDDSSP